MGLVTREEMETFPVRSGLLRAVKDHMLPFDSVVAIAMSFVIVAIILLPV